MSRGDLVRILTDRAASHPTRAYLHVRGCIVTYAELAATAQQLALRMRHESWDQGTGRIAVSLDDQERLLYMVWACAQERISLAFCPRCEDSDQMLKAVSESGATTLVTDIESLRTQSWVKAADAVTATSAAPADASPAFPAERECSFLFQTSGTEGEPKWVVCQYWQCFEAVESMWQDGRLRHAVDQTVFLTAPLFHSYGLSSLFEYTRAGATFILPSGDSPMGPVGELRTPVAQQITAIEAVPHFYFQFSRLAGRMPLPKLRHIGFGGGRLDENAVTELRRHYPELTYSVRYGLTETPSVVTHKVFAPPYSENWRSSGPVVPIYHLEIAGPGAEVLGPDQEGEIVVKGECVASYAGRGESERKGVLNTGDLGYLTAAGELVVTGRRSSFLKHRGYRLSPEKLELVVRLLDSVEDCRVRMSDTQQLLAEIVYKGTPLAKKDVLAHMAQHLPVYSIPDEVVEVEQIPRTRSGKIKRH